MTTSATAIVNQGSYSGPMLTYDMAVATGIKSVGFFGTDGPTSALNVVSDVSGVADSAVVGTPVYASGYATFAGTTNYIQTPVAGASKVTLFGVVRSFATMSSNSTNPGLFGNLVNATSGFGVFGNVVSTVKNMRIYRVLTVGGTPTNVSANLAWPDPTVWTFVCAVADAGNFTLYNKTLGTNVSVTNANTPVLGGNYRMGSSGGLYTDTLDMAIGGVYTGAALTAGEVETLYQQIKAECAGFSTPITI